MFRMSAGTVHTWQDIAKNVGKLSLAGLFLGGSFFLAHAYAATTPIDSVSHQSAVQAMISTEGSITNQQ